MKMMNNVWSFVCGIEMFALFLSHIVHNQAVVFPYRDMMNLCLTSEQKTWNNYEPNGIKNFLKIPKII